MEALCVGFGFFARINGFWRSVYVDKWQHVEMETGPTKLAGPV
jgi:hypothetical protein